MCLMCECMFMNCKLLILWSRWKMNASINTCDHDVRDTWSTINLIVDAAAPAPALTLALEVSKPNVELLTEWVHWGTSTCNTNMSITTIVRLQSDNSLADIQVRIKDNTNFLLACVNCSQCKKQIIYEHTKYTF